jgi:hypothetical protein
MGGAVLSGIKLPGNEVYHSPVSIAETKIGKLDLYPPPHMPVWRGDTFTFCKLYLYRVKIVVNYMKPITFILQCAVPCFVISVINASLNFKHFPS